MNAASSAKVAGMLALLWCCGIAREPRPLYGHADNCPLGGCQLAAPPALDWPLDPPAPTVTLKVRVPACSPPGKEIEYRYFIENCAPADAHHVIIKNPLPPNVKFVRASPAPHQLEPELQWRLGTMKAGGKCEISLIVIPLGPEDVRNCVRIQFEHGQCVTTRVTHAQPGMPPFGPPGQQEPPLGKRPPEIEPKIEPKVEPVPSDSLPKLKLHVDGLRDRYANMPVTYRITVTNEGKTAATNLQVWATLPEKSDFVNASENGIHLLGRVAWNLKDLEPGGKRTVELVYKSQGTGQRCVSVFALADRNVSAQAEYCTNFAGVSALLLEMFDREDPVALGGDTSFPIVVQNTGTAPVNNVTIRAFLPPSMVLTKTVPADHREEQAPQGRWLIFGPMAPLAPGAKGDIEVHVKCVAAGDARFKIELTADQLDRGPVIEEESILIYEENGKLPVKMLSRKRK